MRTFNPSSLLTFLNTGAPYREVNLLTITLQSGTVIRLTDSDRDEVADSNTFLHTGPIFQRSGVAHKRGLEASEMTIDFSWSSTDQISTVSWMESMLSGAFDYARITVDVGVFDVTAPTVLLGWYNWFDGEVANIPELGLQNAKMVVKSGATRLDVLMPRNLIQPGCLHTLFDMGCGISLATLLKTGTINSVNGDGSLACTITGGATTGFYDQGVLTVTSGTNNNVVRKIKQNVNGNFYLFAPLVFVPSGGTTITVSPGCDKTKATCTSKFSNLNNFRGMPYVPTPETMI